MALPATQIRRRMVIVFEGEPCRVVEFRHHTPGNLRANLSTAVDRIKAKRPDATIVVVQMEALPNLGAKYTSDFHDVYPTIAAEKHVTLIPFLLGGVAGQRNLNQADGVHPNNAGEKIVAENVWKGLKPVLEGRK